jgi:asparagine synthase (glutamine-hydrolysing)
MAGALAHRGPDAEGVWVDERAGVGLAHRRLSIVDLAGGDQPLWNEDESVVVVFNGEIYNYPALRRELEAKGHVFRTHSDTEVLVHLYEEEERDLVGRLRGMFAFALWDCRKQQLLLARDRLGLKPLYVYRDAAKLLFGSELKAILACPGVDRTLDLEAVEDYFCYGVIAGERSIFQRIRKLAPGHTLLVSTHAWDAAPRRYWQYRPTVDRALSLSDWKEAIAAKINETVAAHRLADVPIGAFLSGGVDSSVIVATLARLSGGSFKTFSIGFGEERFSELPYAREVARRFGCEHIEEIVTPEAAKSLDDLVRFYDEPFADSSAIPTMHVSRLASRHVKVVLSGDGGDEAFGGYSRYAHDLHEAAWRRRIPGWARKRVLGPLARRWPKSDWLPRPLRAKTRLTNLSLSPAEAYANTLAWRRSADRRRLLTKGVVEQLNGYRPEQVVCEHYQRGSQDDELACMIAADIGVLLPDDFLTKVDRASMAFGLEVRPPLVDHELLELTGQIPSEFKVHRGETKWIFKEIYRDQLPTAVTSRAKQGFEIPVDAWLRGPLADVFESTVLDPANRASDFLDQGEARRLYQSHRRGSGRHGSVLWSLLIFARWADEYLTTSTTTVGV